MAQWLLIKQVQVSCVNDLGQMSRNDHDIQYLYIFIKSISFRLQAAIVSENQTFSPFPTEKRKFQNLTGVKYVEAYTGSSFVQAIIGRSPRWYILSFVEIGLLVPDKIFEGFLPYTGMYTIFAM